MHCTSRPAFSSLYSSESIPHARSWLGWRLLSWPHNDLAHLRLFLFAVWSVKPWLGFVEGLGVVLVGILPRFGIVPERIGT